MMAANVVQHKTRSRRARVVETPHVRRARTYARAHAWSPASSNYVYVHVHVRAYVHRCTCRVSYPRCIRAEDQPPDPFRRPYIGVFPFLPPPLPSFFPPRFSFPPVVRPAARPSTYLPVSYTTGRVGTVLVTTFPRRSFGKRRIFSSSLLLSPLLLFIRPAYSVLFSHVENSTVLLCMSLQRKRLGRGKLSCRIQRGDRRDTGDKKGNGGEEESDGEGEREMIIHSAVITQSPAP